jgi:hypothetical protein
VESSALAGLDAQTVKATELYLGVLGSTDGNVTLDDFVTGEAAVVGNGRFDGEEYVPELRVATWSTTSGDASLG